MKVFEVVQGSTSLDGLRRAERPLPEPGPGEVRVRIRAVALNYRDIAVVRGQYFGGPVARALIPMSDAAGEVDALGSGVTAFAPGDRVIPCFAQGTPPAALGSPLDGVLCEYAVFREDGLVRMPSALSFEQAATLPCAGVTAWNAVIEGKRLRPGQTVLVLGTGGVSIFALQLARLAGARVIVTSSSDEKLDRAKALGASDAINYRRTPSWEQRVLELTGGHGADHIVESVGAATLPQSFAAVAHEGEIALLGVLAPPANDLNPHALMPKHATLRGIFVGDRAALEALCRAIDVNRLEPVVDQVFEFEQAPAAYHALQSATHFGKLVIRM